jgi:Nucleotidyl transferase AbiEii toxin, Type IV TA system
LTIKDGWPEQRRPCGGWAPPEPQDLARICRSLNSAGAQYILIGGFAVIAHGAGRFTKDIDLLIDDAPENVARVKAALSVLADNAASEVADDDLRTYVVVRVVDEVVIDGSMRWRP